MKNSKHIVNIIIVIRFLRKGPCWDLILESEIRCIESNSLRIATGSRQALEPTGAKETT